MLKKRPLDVQSDLNSLQLNQFCLVAVPFYSVFKKHSSLCLTLMLINMLMLLLGPTGNAHPSFHLKLGRSIETRVKVK